MLEKKARALAIKCHDGQFRKDGITPYIKHAEAVVNLLKEIGIKDENIICAAWLHDVIEDSNISKEEIAKEMNNKVADTVQKLTRDIDREDYKKRIQNASYEVQIIKLADMVHNCSELFDYLPEKTIKRKVEDCKELYLNLAKIICPKFYSLLKKYIKPWVNKY